MTGRPGRSLSAAPEDEDRGSDREMHRPRRIRDGKALQTPGVRQRCTPQHLAQASRVVRRLLTEGREEAATNQPEHQGGTNPTSDCSVWMPVELTRQPHSQVPQFSPGLDQDTCDCEAFSSIANRLGRDTTPHPKRVSMTRASPHCDDGHLPERHLRWGSKAPGLPTTRILARGIGYRSLTFCAPHREIAEMRTSRILDRGFGSRNSPCTLGARSAIIKRVAWLRAVPSWQTRILESAASDGRLPQSSLPRILRFPKPARRPCLVSRTDPRLHRLGSPAIAVHQRPPAPSPARGRPFCTQVGNPARVPACASCSYARTALLSPPRKPHPARAGDQTVRAQ